MATDIKSLKDKQDSLVVMARDAAVLAAPYGTVIPAGITTDPVGNLMSLPSGWGSVGELDQQAGITITPDLQTAEVHGYGSMGARRVVVTKETVTVGFTAQESRALNLEMFWGGDFKNKTPDANGEVVVKRGYESTLKYWSLLIIGQDDNEFGRVLDYWVFPKVTITSKEAVKLGQEEALVYPLTFTAFEDATYGGYVGVGQAGVGFTATALTAGYDNT